MIRHPKCTSVMVLLFALLSASSALAQSIAVRLTDTNKVVSLEATSPGDLAYRIQSSTDFQNWVDISDPASGSFSYKIDPVNDQNRFFRLSAWQIDDSPITMALIGDSTIAEFAVNLEQFYGWGPGMVDYLKPNVRLVNLGVPYQSTKSFLTSIEKDNLELIKPEFVLVNLGLMDSASYAENYFTSLADYETNLKSIVQFIRGFNGIPILVTPSTARWTDSQGKVIPFLEDRCAVMRKVSTELHTYLIDLNTLSRNLYDELGPTASAYITAGELDRTHFTLAGAKTISGLIVDAFPNILHPQVLEKP